jgi:hypothetical protein
MNREDFKEYVEKRYNDQVSYYSKAASKNQKLYKQYQWILIVLSASTPILAAFNPKQMQLPIIIISASVAILTAVLKTFQYQELWINYRATNELLKPEIYYYKFEVGPYAEEGIDKEVLFVSRVESILDKEHVNWPAAKKLANDKKAEHDKTKEK